MAIVYQHRRLDTNEIFYIGIGKTIARSKSKAFRNRHWHHIVNKIGYIIEILHNNITWDEACELEINYIKQYGRKDLGTGILVNMTDGGEGKTNVFVSKETRKKISETKKKGKLFGEKSFRFGKTNSEETRKKISQSMTGRFLGSNSPLFGKKHTEEQNKKHSELMKGRFVGEKNPMFGKTQTKETRKKISELMIGRFSGEKHHMYGKSHSEETKLKCGEKRKVKIIQIDKNTEEIIKVWDCAKNAGLELKIDSASITKVCKNKVKTAGGYKWKYFSDVDLVN
jgi:hypothetical protein